MMQIGETFAQIIARLEDQWAAERAISTGGAVPDETGEPDQRAAPTLRPTASGLSVVKAARGEPPAGPARG